MSDDSVRTGEQGAAPVQDHPADQVESLDDLALEGKRLHEGAATPGAPGAPATVVDQPPKLADIVDMLVAVREMAGPAAAEAGVLTEAQVATIWDDARLERIARPLLAIMQRHNLNNIEAAFDKWGPYAMLMAGLVVPGFATWRAIREHQSAAHAAAQ